MSMYVHQLLTNESPWWGVVDNGGGYVCVGAQLYMKSLYLPLNGEPRTALKNKAIKKSHSQILSQHLNFARVL